MSLQAGNEFERLDPETQLQFLNSIPVETLYFPENIGQLVIIEDIFKKIQMLKSIW